MPSKMYLAFFILSIKSNLLAQDMGNFRLLLHGQHTQFNSNFVREVGLTAEYYVSKHWSITYTFGFGGDSRRKFYTHIPTGVWIAAYPFTAFVQIGDDYWLYLAILSAIIPEGINYHIRVSDSFHISPFVAPLGMYYEERANNLNASFNWGGTTGVRFNVFKQNFSFAPYLGIRATYQRGSKLGTLGGLNLAITF